MFIKVFPILKLHTGSFNAALSLYGTTCKEQLYPGEKMECSSRIGFFFFIYFYLLEANYFTIL